MSTARHIKFLVNRMYLGKSRGLATQGKRYNNKEADSICYYTLEGEVATGARIYLVQTEELKIDFHLWLLQGYLTPGRIGACQHATFKPTLSMQQCNSLNLKSCICNLCSKSNGSKWRTYINRTMFSLFTNPSTNSRENHMSIVRWKALGAIKQVFSRIIDHIFVALLSCARIYSEKNKSRLKKIRNRDHGVS